MYKFLQNKFALSERGTRDLISGSLYSALVNLSMLIPVGIFILLLQEIMQLVTGKGLALPNLGQYLGYIFLAGVFIYFCQYYQYSSVFLATYQESAMRRISLAEKIRHLPLAFFAKRDLSDLTNTIMGDCATLEHAFSHAVPQFLGAVLSTVLISLGLLSLNFKLGLAVLWVIPGAFLIIVVSKYYQHKAEFKHYKAKRICAEGIQECLETIQEIKASGMQKTYLNNLDIKFDKAELANIYSELTMGSCVTSAQAFLRLGIPSVILVGANLLVTNKIDLLTYLIFLLTASRLYEPLSATLANIAEIFMVEIPLKRMREIDTQFIQKGEKAGAFKNFDIEFTKVSFAYTEGDKVLQEVSFCAKQGEVTALVGPSGSGKSTVAKLAARFWEVNAGVIKLGGQDISKIEPEELLKNYAIVFQDVTLFNDTIIDNIRLGKPLATDEAVLQAAKLARCDEFIKNLPQGYATKIGENGICLSGGQRQRISIARAILKDAPVILLDEATASLDVENETSIQLALTELIRNKTVIIIAHRLRTVANADQIIVLAEGKVVQAGKHESLVKQAGIYKKMYDIQQKTTAWSI